jgi:hypothetical protein
MAASFPNAKKTFTQAVNGLTKLVALLFNSNYDETEAIETFIGAIGSTQAYSESLTNFLSKYVRGAKIEYKSATDIYVRSGEICFIDVSGNRRLRRNTSDLTVDWTMIDTGAEAASTKYYIWALADASGTTFTIKISASASVPSGSPAFYKLLGSFYNDANSDIHSETIVNNKEAGENGMVKVDGVYAYALTSITLSGLLPGKAYKLIINLLQNTNDGTIKVRFNADTGNNYNWHVLDIFNGSSGNTGSATGDSVWLSEYATDSGSVMTGEVFFTTVQGNGHNVQMNGNIEHYNLNGVIVQGISGCRYTGAADLSSITLLTAAGTFTGTAELFEMR